MSPRSAETAIAAGSSGRTAPVRRPSRANSIAPTICMPVVTRRLPMTRLASAVMTSRVPQARAAPKPASRPKGIGGA